MMKKTILMLAAAAFAATAAAGPLEKIALDSKNTKVSWKARKISLTHDGAFAAVSGQIGLLGGKAEASTVTLDIDATTISSDNDMLTGHLKSADFFDVAKFPKATFVATKIRPAGKPDADTTHIVNGKLTIRGVTRPVMVPAKIEVLPDSVKASGKITINRKEWGLVYPGKPDDLIQDDVVIAFSVDAPRPAAAKKG